MRKRDHDLLDYYHNRYLGRRCWIIGTGPSLLKIDHKLFAQLKGEMTFGVNFLVKVPGLPFTPTFYCASEIDDLARVDSTLKEWEAAKSKVQAKFFGCMYSPNAYLPPPAYEDWTWVYRDHGRNMQEGDFSGLEEPFDWVAEGYGVVFDIALPVACWMGFKQVYLLGCDATSEGHAHPDDASSRQRGNRGRQDTVQRCALGAMNAMKAHGRELLDCTEGGSLPLPKVGLGSVLKG